MVYAIPRRLQMMQLCLQLGQQQQQDALALGALLRERDQRRERRRWFWVRPWIQRRVMFGNYDNLMVELEREAEGDFTNFLRMEPMMFHELLQTSTPRLTKQETRLRQPLDLRLKLAITLQYLATGNSYNNFTYSF